LAGVAPDFTAYLDAMISERKASVDPPDDFVTRLINTEIDGEHLSDVEMRTQLAFLLMSGNETTRHLIANLLETACTHTALFALDVFLDRVEQAQVDNGYKREPVPVFWANGPRRLPVNLTGVQPNAPRS